MENPVPTRKEPNFFEKMLRKISPQHKRNGNQNPQWAMGTHPIEVREEEKLPESPPKIEGEISIIERTRKESVAQGRQLDVGKHFAELLQQKGTISEYFTSGGELALRETNEKLDHALIEKVQSQKEAPNGYLIGIGAANVIRMLELFPEGQIPKAMILFDINYSVVNSAESFIEKLKQQPDDQNTDIWPLDRIISDPVTRSKINLILKRLAKEGNLVIKLADFTDPKVFETLSDLPDIHNVNNVIYLSNISDHVWRNSKFEKIADFNFLEILKPQGSHKNYYIDTIQRTLNYNLRVSTQIPQFSTEDFDNDNRSLFQIRQIDEIEGQENLLKEGMMEWPDEDLKETYRKLLSGKRQQQHSNDIVLDLNETRKRVLDQYEDWKKGFIPSRYDYSHLSPRTKFVLPTDPEEEAQVKKELAANYSYEKDFIPFLAHNVWTESNRMDLSFENHLLEEPKEFVSSYENPDKPYWIKDPRHYIRGRIELRRLSSLLNYDDLVLAKIYKELERRGLLGNLSPTTAV